MRILITGATGMLGSDLCKELKKEHELTGLARGVKGADNLPQGVKLLRVDITNKLSVVDAIGGVRPDLIVHTAAYTDVDGCELNSDKAHQVNALGTQNVALGAQTANCLIIYISTDYVFDGEKGAPYLETDATGPINAYGVSKLEGEEFVSSLLEKYIILRSSWLFGCGGRNFVDGIIAKARRGDELKIVSDQIGTPTYTVDLAQAIGKLINKLRVESKEYREERNLYGIYHVTNAGSCSRFEEARKAIEFAKLNSTKIKPITSAEAGRPARRPRMSVLENKRYAGLFGENLRPWDAALREYVEGGSRRL